MEKKSGIYEFLLSRNSDPFAYRLLSLREFDEDDKILMYEKQEHKCALYHKIFAYQEMAEDHIKPWSKGGKTTLENLQMLCKNCNSKKI